MDGQSLFNKYQTVEGKPWKTTDEKYLLFDFVHLGKNVRNCWITDKCGELEYYDGGIKKVAPDYWVLH